MELGGTIDGFILLLILGLATLAFFLRQRTSTPTGVSAQSASLNDEERRKRREKMAAIAEERAMAKRLQEADDDEIALNSNNKIGIAGETLLRKTAPIMQSHGKDIIEGGKGEHNSADDADIPVAVGKNDTENPSVNDDGDSTPNNTMGLQAKGEDQARFDERHSSVSKEGNIEDEKCEHENNSIGGGIVNDVKIDDVVEESVVNDCKGDHGNGGVDSEHEDDAESKLVDPLEGNAKDRGTKSEADHRERHAKAIAKIMEKKGKQDANKPAVPSAKIMEKKGEQDAKKPAVPSLTIYLILTSSPGSSRLELSIPANVSAASLLHRASKASGVASDKLKLIFRGQIITEHSTARCVIDELKIENGSVLHVVGKPQQSKEDKDSSNSEEDNNRNSGEEDSSSSSESEDGNDSEEDARGRAPVMEAIRSSSGEGVYHRAAQQGDLNALREAVNTGHSDFLHVADSNGWTPLHEAVRAGHVDVVEYLVQEGGLGVDEVTNQGSGWSPLSLALEHHGRDHPVTAMLQVFLNQADPSANNPWDDETEEM